MTPRTAEATQLIALQIGCDEKEALRHLRERAEALQYRVHDYAKLVLDGIVRFAPDPPEHAPEARIGGRA